VLRSAGVAIMCRHNMVRQRLGLPCTSPQKAATVALLLSRQGTLDASQPFHTKKMRGCDGGFIKAGPAVVLRSRTHVKARERIYSIIPTFASKLQLQVRTL
jgi:hypothetical protein